MDTEELRSMETVIDDVFPIIAKMVRSLRQNFGEGLISVVIYGSYAKGNAGPSSDIDLLVVVKGLPRDWDIIHSMEKEWMRKGRFLGKRFHIVFVSPEDVEESVECAAPLMLEIYDAHKVFFDRGKFFQRCIGRMEGLIKERDIHKRRQGVWEVPEDVVSP